MSVRITTEFVTAFWKVKNCTQPAYSFYNIMIIMLSKYICHCNMEFFVFQGFFLIFHFSAFFAGGQPCQFCPVVGKVLFFDAFIWKYPEILYILYLVIYWNCLLFCFFWQFAIKNLAHNNHYVVWSAVPAVLACAAGVQLHP